MKNNFVNKLIAGTASALLALSLTCAPAFAENTAAAAAAEAQRTVTVSGTGYATVTPDTAAVVFSVSTTAEAARDAQDENAKKSDAILEALKALELDEKDIRTSAYNISPEYTYDDNGNASVSGYTAFTELTVSNQTIDMAGTVLSAGVNAGVNAVSSVRYSCSTYDDAYKQALADAVKSAQGKAEALAAASDDSLGDVTSLTEGYEDTSLRSAKYADAAMAIADSSDVNGITLMPGESQITATVTAVYALED